MFLKSTSVKQDDKNSPKLSTPTSRPKPSGVGAPTESVGAVNCQPRFTFRKSRILDSDKSESGLPTGKGFTPTPFFTKLFPRNSAQSASRKQVSGFTMIELLVSISIIVIFSLVFLTRYQAFTSRIGLTNLSYDVGLTLREAQVFGISVKEQSLGDFSYAYGVRFRISDPQNFHSFIDINGNGRLNGGSEETEAHTIRNSNSIVDLCALEGGTEYCGLQSAHITFLRPDPDANFVTTPSHPNASEIEIHLESNRTNERKVVTVTNTGQITIE